MCVQSRYDFEAPAVPFASQLAEFARLPVEYHVDVMHQENFTRGRLLRALLFSVAKSTQLLPGIFEHMLIGP
jgi:hypothetical protein